MSDIAKRVAEIFAEVAAEEAAEREAAKPKAEVLNLEREAVRFFPGRREWTVGPDRPTSAVMGTDRA